MENLRLWFVLCLTIWIWISSNLLNQFQNIWVWWLLFYTSVEFLLWCWSCEEVLMLFPLSVVEQVLNIIRNLSFDEVNSCVLAESEACVRLLLLAAHAKWSCLPQIAFDALSNLASEVSGQNHFIARQRGALKPLRTLEESSWILQRFSRNRWILIIPWTDVNICLFFIQVKLKEPADCLLSSVLLGTITRGLESSDRFIILRCMESLSRMAQRNENVSLMVSFLDSQVSFTIY